MISWSNYHDVCNGGSDLIGGTKICTKLVDGIPDPFPLAFWGIKTVWLMRLVIPIQLYQELIIRRREYRTVKLSPESNVTIQLRFDALTCCVFANIIQASANQVM